MMGSAAMPDIRPRDKKWLVLGVVAIGTMMSTLDASIVAVAMPTLTDIFRTEIAVSQWFVLAYTSTVTICLLVSGKLGDILGRRRIYFLGIGIFTVGSAACAMSVSAHMLIATRSAQAVGASMMMAIGPALVTSAFPSHERGKSLGLAGSSVALGLLAGPLAGGVIIQHFSWQWLFLINVPVGLALLVAAARLDVPESRRATGLDLPGAILLAASIGFLLAALNRGQSVGWASSAVWISLTLAAASAAGFVVVERFAKGPLLRLSLFKHRDFALGALTGWVNYAATSPVPVFIPFYLQHVLQCSAQLVGLVLACGPLTLALTAPIAGAISDRIGSRPLTVAGLALAGVGLVLLAKLSPSSTIADVIFRLVLTSLGSAIFVSPNSSAVMGSVPKEELGVAAGVVALVRNLGMVCGVAVAGSIITTVQQSFAATGEIGRGEVFQGLAFLAGLRSALLACATVAFVGACVSSFRTSPSRPIPVREV